MNAAESVSASEPEKEHRIVGRYSVGQELGAGGAGVVYRAEDTASGRVVAFKQLLSSRAGSKRKMAETLFEREYHTLARLKHPRIIEVFDYGLTADGPYYTMELLGGKDLSQLGRLPYKEVCRHLRDVASSLALLHAHRLVHRDVSSRNIRLTADGQAKLLDFGALASFGTASDVVGTPLYMAPETVLVMALDNRTDLYSLGAVGYFALTGRHPYKARTIADLPFAWASPPLPPSTFAPDIPAELDRLILSLISLDPLGRPPSAAAVIDRLTVLGDLPSEPHDPAAESYLLSSQMVGRQKELDWVTKRVRRALKGSGGEVFIEGPPGIGKTRLLNELCLAAQLKGVLTLKADAEAVPDNFGAVSSLALNLLRLAPESAKRAAEPHAEVLGDLSPELANRLGTSQAAATASAATALDPSERRALLQTALHEWFLAVAREHTLILAVDNVHAADDNSAAFLAALGRVAWTSPILLLVTHRSGTKAVSQTPVRMIRERSGRLKLAGLDAALCEALASSLFGNVANAGRVGQLLYEKSAGIPQQYIDLVHYMVRQKVAKYIAGTWVLPLDVGDDELPSQAEEILRSRLSGLSDAAVEIMEVLSIHGKPVPIDLIRALARDRGEGETYAALDELVAEQILASEGTSYRFRQETVREAVLGRMDAARRRASHLNAAETILATDGISVGGRIDAALQLLEAGEETRGAKVLVGAAREFVASSGTHDSPDQAARALHRMVQVYEKQGRSEYELSALLFPLMALAYYSSHWRFVLEYGERSIDIGLRITGLRRAAELEPSLGREAALWTGLGAAAAEFQAHGVEDLGYDLMAAIASCCAMVPAIVGTCATCLDKERVKRVVDLAAPLKMFGEDHVAAAMYEFAGAELRTVQGCQSEAMLAWEHALSRYEDPKIVEALGVGHAKSIGGGVLFTMGILDAQRVGHRALETAERMEALGVRTWAMAADQVRLLYHSFRGQSERVQYYRDRVELFAVQGSTTWQAEMFWPALLLHADVLTSDTIAARRTWEQLARRTKDVAALGPYAEGAHAAYLMLRGELAASIALYEDVLADFPIRDRAGWETTRGYFARALNLAGQPARAKEIAQEVLSNMVPADREYVIGFLESERQLALAEAGLGNHAEAIRILDRLLATHGQEDNDLLAGLLHQARAEVALLERDTAGFERHFAQMETRFRTTKCPALVAQCDRLRHHFGQSQGSSPAEVSTFDTAVSPSKQLGLSSVSTAAELSAAADPGGAALEVVMLRAKAKSGFLYVVKAGALQLVSASHPNEPPIGLETELRRLVDGALVDERKHAGREPSGETSAPETALAELERRAVAGSDSLSSDGIDDDNHCTKLADSMPPTEHQGPYRLVLLRTPAGGSLIMVGGFILEAEPENMFRVGSDLLEAVARMLHERRHEPSLFLTVIK